jgi:hypothetical protein
MKIVFALLLVLHGLIHMMGFAKAFQLASINQLTQSISKPMGMLWVLTSILFILSAFVFLIKKEYWFLIAISAIVLSQILIIIYWKDAKFGSILNVIILLVSISAFGNYAFNLMVKKEADTIIANSSNNSTIIYKEDCNQLPEIVQKWMQTSGVIGSKKAVSARLKQIGQMRTKRESKWMPFIATQYYNIEKPSFIWFTEVDVMPAIKMIGRDKFYNNKGEMLIKLASIIPIVDESNNEQINSGTMLRFLGEVCWFPSSALNDYIIWETIDAKSAKATLTINQKSVSGLFTFTLNGDMVSFEADRYYGGGKNAKLEKWVISVEEYKVFEGSKIPYKCHVTWKLKEGDFIWLILEIVDMEYNIHDIYL